MEMQSLARLLSLYERGVITTPEITNGLIVRLMEREGSDDELPSFVAGLPDEVQQRLRNQLQEIRRTHYRWKFFWIGPGGSVLASEAEDSERLRRICSALKID